jgi:hypothetical protein
MAAGAGASSPQQYLELRVYRLGKPGADHSLLDAYLEKAAIPALNRLGISPIGAFTETEGKDDPAIYVLVPYPTIESFATMPARLKADAQFQEAGADYLQTPKSKPGFLRIDSWLMLAFAGMPKVNVPPYCREKKPRLFEIRTYESYSETKAQKKVDMFNAGEIETMLEVGLGPIFFGQTLLGANLPHLIYMLSAETREAHNQHWAGFRDHPTWKKLQADRQYADTVSKSTNRFLAPMPYSQI